MNTSNKDLVCHANQLTEARYTLSVVEQRLILSMIAKISPDDTALKPYQIALADFPRLLNIRSRDIYTDIKQLLKQLSARVLEIEKGEGYLVINWISSAEYLPESQAIELCFDQKLMPYLINLKEQFTLYGLAIIIQFQSIYAIRLYQLLKQYEAIGHRTFELSELRTSLGIDPDKYPEFKEFKRRVLNQAKKEFETTTDAGNKSDISFDCQFTREGRRITRVHFSIYQQSVPDVQSHSTTQQQNPSPELDATLQQIPEAHRHKKTVHTALQRFLKSQGQAYVLRNIGYTNDHATTSYAGYLNNCLKEDWGCDWTSESAAAKTYKRIAGIPINEIEQQARPGESWEQAAGRMTQGKSQTSRSS